MDSFICCPEIFELSNFGGALVNLPDMAGFSPMKV